jgi:hypothetical protein
VADDEEEQWRPSATFEPKKKGKQGARSGSWPREAWRGGPGPVARGEGLEATAPRAAWREQQSEPSERRTVDVVGACVGRGGPAGAMVIGPA